MVLGPIFRLELVSAARRRRYFLARVVYGAIILFVLWATYESATAYRAARYGETVSIRQTAETAAHFFLSFSWVQLIGILAAAPAMAVGTIATERERRTIEYLFTTDLSNLEIVLGKTLARLMLVGKFVLVSLPILFLFRLLGGIPADLLAGSFIIAGSTAIFLTALSVCVSVWAPRSRDAAMRVYRTLAALLFLPPILSGFLTLPFVPQGGWRIPVDGVLSLLRDLNPLWVLGRSMTGIVAMGAGFDFAPVLHMAAWHAGLAIGLTALATAAVRRVHLRESTSVKPVKAPRAARRGRFSRWRPAVADRPMIWKEAIAPASKTKLGWAAGIANVLVVLVALGAIAYAFVTAVLLNQYWDFEGYFVFAGIFSGVVGSGILLLLGARASGLVSLERERDCWDSLLATPLTGREIMSGKMLGNLYSARWGFALVSIAWALGALLDVRYLAPASVMALALTACACFVTNLGLFFSLRSRTSLRAMGITLACGVFLGGGYLMCCCPIAAFGSGRGSEEFMALGMAPCMPFLLTAPSVVFVDGFDARMGSALTVAYGLGVVAYLASAAALLGYFAYQFDAVAGRTVRAEGKRPPGSNAAPSAA